MKTMGNESEPEVTSDWFGESKENRVRILIKPVQKTTLFAKTAFSYYRMKCNKNARHPQQLGGRHHPLSSKN